MIRLMYKVYTNSVSEFALFTSKRAVEDYVSMLKLMETPYSLTTYLTKIEITEGV